MVYILINALGALFSGNGTFGKLRNLNGNYNCFEEGNGNSCPQYVFKVIQFFKHLLDPKRIDLLHHILLDTGITIQLGCFSLAFSNNFSK